jgi:hypothetical protein
VNSQLPRTTETPEFVAGLHRDILTALQRRDEAALTTAVVAHFGGINQRIATAL